MPVSRRNSISARPTLGANVTSTPMVVVHAPASCGRGLEGDGRSFLEVTGRRRRRHENSWEIVLSNFPWNIHTEKMPLNYASLPHVLSLSSLLSNSPSLDRRLDNDLITSARRAVSLLARPTHACTCYCKFPGNQGRGKPVWSWAAATQQREVADGADVVFTDTGRGFLLGNLGSPPNSGLPQIPVPYCLLHVFTYIR